MTNFISLISWIIHICWNLKLKMRKGGSSAANLMKIKLANLLKSQLQLGKFNLHTRERKLFKIFNKSKFNLTSKNFPPSSESTHKKNIMKGLRWRITYNECMLDKSRTQRKYVKRLKGSNINYAKAFSCSLTKICSTLTKKWFSFKSWNCFKYFGNIISRRFSRIFVKLIFFLRESFIIFL